MTDLERIKESVALRLTLSEMLFKLLWKDRCWHEPTFFTWHPNIICCFKCGKKGSPDSLINPDLFSGWTGFGKVFEAVKDREDFHYRFVKDSPYLDEIYPKRDYPKVAMSLIVSPHFQLSVLQWLLEQEGRAGELESVLSKEGEG